MTSYIYLLSSLPSLSTGRPAPFDYDGFLEACRFSVDDRTYDRLASLTADSSQGRFMKEWNEFYGRLMARINYLRRVRLGKPAVPADVGADIARLADEAMKAGDPLTAERALLDAQFALVDRLTNGHYFDEYVLFGYALKLRLLLRANAFNAAEGEAEFRRMFGVIQQRILDI